MELWEEMKGADGLISMQTQRNGEIMVFMQEFKDGRVSRPVVCTGITEADAISGAWLKWKEGA